MRYSITEDQPEIEGFCRWFGAVRASTQNASQGMQTGTLVFDKKSVLVSEPNRQEPHRKAPLTLKTTL